MSVRTTSLVAFTFVLSVIFLAGCGSSSEETFSKVKLDPDQIAADIMAEYDTDSDGEISKSELKKSDGLSMLTSGQEMMQPEMRLDSDESGTISEAEFANKFRECFKSMRQSYSCRVTYRGRPLPGATVTLVPESFMGDAPTASGETNEDGVCDVVGEDGLIGTVPGIYKIEVTHPEVKIPSKYNTAMTLGTALDTTNPYAQAGVPEIRLR